MSADNPSAVDRLFGEATAVIEILQKGGEVSLQIAASDYFRKALLLAAASHFEQRICGCVLDFVKERANGSSMVENFVRNKAITRQYHTWFSWEVGNANQFFALFGAEFRNQMSERSKGSEETQRSVRAFLEIGNERNRLVHQDFATFPLEKTLDEIYQLYKTASAFVDDLPVVLREFQ